MAKLTSRYPFVTTSQMVSDTVLVRSHLTPFVPDRMQTYILAAGQQQGDQDVAADTTCMVLH